MIHWSQSLFLWKVLFHVNYRSPFKGTVWAKKHVWRELLYVYFACVGARFLGLSKCFEINVTLDTLLPRRVFLEAEHDEMNFLSV